MKSLKYTEKIGDNNSKLGSSMILKLLKASTTQIYISTMLFNYHSGKKYSLA
jgi:hypothetical protein